jgi:hypothetical protein
VLVREGGGGGRGFFPCPKWNSSLVFNVKFYYGKFHSQGKKNFDSSYCSRFPSWGSEKNALETVQNCTVPTIVFFILRAEKIRRRAPDLSAFLTVYISRSHVSRSYSSRSYLSSSSPGHTSQGHTAPGHIYPVHLQVTRLKVIQLQVIFLQFIHLQVTRLKVIQLQVIFLQFINVLVTLLFIHLNALLHFKIPQINFSWSYTFPVHISRSYFFHVILF